MRHYLEPDPDHRYVGTLRYADIEWHVVANKSCAEDDQVTVYLLPASPTLERLDVVVHIATGFVLPVSSVERPDPAFMHAVSVLLNKSLLPSLRRRGTRV